MSTPRPLRLPSFEEINKKKNGGSDFGGLNRPNPYFDNPLVNREGNHFSRTFSGPARRAVPTVAPVPDAVHQITGRHAGPYIEESEGTHVARGRRINRGSAEESVGSHMGPREVEQRGDYRKDYTGHHTKDLTPGRHRAQTRIDRVKSALSAYMLA